MSVVVKSREGTTTITLGNTFDFDSVDEFRSAYSQNQGTNYIVDFRHTDYMDSSGLGMLLNMRRHLGDGNVPIQLVNCRPQVAKVLAISRFETKFDIR